MHKPLRLLLLLLFFIALSSSNIFAQGASGPKGGHAGKVTQYQLDSALADEMNNEYDSIDWYYVARLLVHGASVNTTNAAHETLLYLSIRQGEDSMTHYLLQNGAKVNLKPGNAFSPLHEACYTQNYLVTQWLLDLGANPNGIGEYGRRPIHFVSDTNVAMLLLKKGASVNQADSQGYTPLHGACAEGNYFLCRFYVRHGANINVLSINGESPMDMASSDEIKYYLLKKGAISGKKDIH